MNIVRKIKDRATSISSTISAGMKSLTIPEVVLLFGVAILCALHYFSSGHPQIPYQNNIIASAALAIFAFLVIWSKKNMFQLPDPLSGSGKTGIKQRYYYLALFVMSVIVYVPAIFSEPYFYNDEFQGVGAAVGFLETGRFVIWDFTANEPLIPYPRAWPYTLALAGFFHLFGISLVTARALSAICGIILIISAFYIFSKMTKNREIAFVTAVLLLINPVLIIVMREVRMYAVILPATIWMVYFAYNALTKTINYRRKNKVTNFIEKYFNFHFGYLLLTLLLVIFIYINHPNSLFTGVGIVLYIFFKSFTSKEHKYKILSSIAVGMFLLIAAFIVLSRTVLHDMVLWGSIVELLRLTGRVSNYIYYWTNIEHPWGFTLGTLFLFAGIYFGWKHRKKNDSFILFSLIQITTVVFFVFFAYRYFWRSYMAFLYPFTTLIIVSGVSYLFYAVSKTAKVLGFTLLSLSIVLSSAAWYSEVYVGQAHRTRFTNAVETIRQDAEHIGLSDIPIAILQSNVLHSRSFYLQHAGNVTVIPLPLIEPLPIPVAIPESRKVMDLPIEIDIILESLDGLGVSKGYTFYEATRFGQSSPSFMYFLRSNTDTLFDGEMALVFRYHFVSPSSIGTAPHHDSDYIETFSYTAGNPQEIDGVLHLNLICRLIYNEYTSGARFLSVRITEKFPSHASEHFVQLLIPGDFSPGQELEFEINLQMQYGRADEITAVPLSFYR